jgi:hypothetical protein
VLLIPIAFALIVYNAPPAKRTWSKIIHLSIKFHETLASSIRTLTRPLPPLRFFQRSSRLRGKV